MLSSVSKKALKTSFNGESSNAEQISDKGLFRSGARSSKEKILLLLGRHTLFIL